MPDEAGKPDFTPGVVPWDRLPRESSKAFEAFVFYRSTPAATRSIRACVERYYPAGINVKSRCRLWERWSSKYRWQERVRAWESEQDRASRAAELVALAQMREKHIRESTTLQGAGLAALQKYAEEFQTTGGKRRMTIRQAVLCILEGAKLERLTRGEPGEIIREDGDLVVEVDWNDGPADS